jgi:hypothetical protein
VPGAAGVDAPEPPGLPSGMPYDEAERGLRLFAAEVSIGRNLTALGF